MGTRIATMYTTARQTSQGLQQAYNCITLPTIKRQTNNINTLRYDYESDLQLSDDEDMGIEEDEQMDNYNLSQTFVSPYSTQTIVNIMREVSGSHNTTQEL